MTYLIRVFAVMLLAASYTPERAHDLQGTYEAGAVGYPATYSLSIVRVGRDEYECCWEMTNTNCSKVTERLRLVNGNWVGRSECWRNQLWILRGGEPAYVISGKSHWWIKRR